MTLDDLLMTPDDTDDGRCVMEDHEVYNEDNLEKVCPRARTFHRPSTDLPLTFP